MSDLLLAKELKSIGLEYGDVRHRINDGELLHLRRGAYTDAADRTTSEEHLLLTRAAIALADSDSVVSFGSAALLHGLPVPDHAIRRVHLTRKRNSSGRIRAGVHVHVAPLDPPEVCEIEGLPVTTLDRTFVDLARTTTLSSAVAAGDAALRQDMNVAASTEQLERASRRRGVRTARRAASMIDIRSESVGESFSRVIMVENQLPRPELQVEFGDTDGFFAVVDFFWPEWDLIGEFDGKIKYGRLLRPGELPGDAVFREKQREDRLRELGFIVVRWVWDDLLHPERLVARIQRAIERTARHR